MPLLTKLDAKLKAENASKKTRFLLRIRNPAPHFDGDHLEAKGARMPVDIDGLNFWFGA